MELWPVVISFLAILLVLFLWGSHLLKKDEWDRPAREERERAAERKKAEEVIRNNRREKTIIKGMLMTEVRRDLGQPDQETTLGASLNLYQNAPQLVKESRRRGFCLYGDTPTEGYITLLEYSGDTVTTVRVEESPRQATP